MQFDSDGALINTIEFNDLIAEVKRENGGTHPYTRLVVASLGWGHSFSDSQRAYADFLKIYLNTRNSFTNRWLVLCVSWPSGMDTMSDALKSVLPSRTVATIIGRPIDLALLPSTVWASAGLADSIGEGDLSDAIQYAIDEGWDKAKTGCPRPKIFLVGHSFGARVLTGALGLRPILVAHKRRGFDPTSLPYYNYRTNIAAAVFIEPAMSLAEVWQIVDFPVFITQSRHDHLNGYIYPVANVPYNFSASPISMDFVDNLNYSVYKEVSAKTNAPPTATHWWIADSFFETEASVVTPIYSSLGILTALTSEIRLERQQTNSSLILDTATQVPLVQIPVEALFPNAGIRSKGLLNLGQFYESASRIGLSQNYYSLRPLLNKFASKDWPVIDSRIGPVFIDCADVINGSVYSTNINYQTSSWQRYTIGWLDPVGSHVDYEHTEIYELISSVLREAYVDRRNHPAPQPQPQLQNVAVLDQGARDLSTKSYASQKTDSAPPPPGP